MRFPDLESTPGLFVVAEIFLRDDVGEGFEEGVVTGLVAGLLLYVLEVVEGRIVDLVGPVLPICD